MEGKTRMTFASIRDRVVKDAERGSVAFTMDGYDRPIRTYPAMYQLAMLISDTNFCADRPILSAVMSCGLDAVDRAEAESRADAIIARLDALLDGTDEDRRDHRLALRWFLRLDRSNDVVAETGSPDRSMLGGLRSAEESERDHVLRNVSSPWNQERVLSANDKDLAVMGLGDIRVIFEDENATDEERADRLLASGQDAAMWLDWLCSRGPHPEEGRWYFRWDGDRHYQVIERDTHRVAYNSRWARAAEAIALVLCDHPHLVTDFEAQDRAAHGDASAEAAWKAIGESIADWRTANLTFFDPWAPKEPSRTPVAIAAKQTSQNMSPTEALDLMDEDVAF